MATKLPVEVTFTEVNGSSDVRAAFERFGPDGVFALHGGDWGSVERIFEVLASAMFGELRTHEDGEIVSLKFCITDTETGEVLHIVSIASDPWLLDGEEEE